MNAISQKDYLKKYLKIGKRSEEKKKKKKVEKTRTKGLKIIDDDIDHSLSHEIQDDLDAGNEDAPQIVAVIDERPPSLRIDETSKSKLWQPIGIASSTSSNYQSFKMGNIKLTKTKDEVFNKRYEDTFAKTNIKINSSNINISSMSSKISHKSPDDHKDNNRKLKDPKRVNKDENLSPASNMEFSSCRDTVYSPQRETKDEQSPYRKANDDYSPPQRNNLKRDNSPPRKSRKDSHSPYKKTDNDHSPPRRNNLKKDNSPPRKNREESHLPYTKTNKDYSPPRRNKFRKDDSSPPRQKRRDDHSPYEKINEDYSPPRRIKIRKDEDFSPPRRSNLKKDDKASLRKRNNDHSPPRKTEKLLKKNDDSSPTRNKKKSRWEEIENDSQTLQKPKTTMSGKKSGLQSAKNLVEDIIYLQKHEEQMFNTMSSDISGVNASTVVRKRKPEVIDPEKEQREKELKEKYMQWGKGIKQVQDEHEKLADQLKEMNKPLARYADDEDLEKYLKEQEREGDPMLAYIRKKKKKVAVEKGIPEKPTYMGDFMPNRFGIRPGYRWDGVDRSNGYEKKWFQVQNSNKAMQEEALMWSTEDM